MRGLIVIVLLGLAGCQNSGGSLGYGRPAPGGGLSIAEQKVIGRERYSLIEDDKLTPRAYVDRPSFVGK